MLHFLKSIFPDHDDEIFHKLLDKNDNNIELCIKALLTDDALETDEDLQHLYSIFPQEESEYLYKTYMDMNGILDTTIEEILSKKSLKDSENKIILPRLNGKSSTFKWTLDMLNYAKELSSAFPQFHEESINDVLEANNGNIAFAAKELADYVSKNDDIKQRHDEQLSNLAIMFPNIPTSKLISIAQKGKSLEEKVEMLLLEESSKSSTDAWSQPILTTKFVESESKSNKDLLQFHFDKPDEERMNLVPNRSNPVARPVHLDPRVLRKKAQDLIYERNLLFEKAASSYKKGQLTGFSSASFYADRAKELNEKVKLTNKEACKAQLEFNKKIHNNELILDLHGLTVNESLLALQEKTRSWTSNRPLRIITGSGNHSKGKGKLFDSSINYIKSIGWKVEKDPVSKGWFDAYPANNV